jgi:ATP-dependent Lon protease
MDNACHILDQSVYGLNDAKMQIMQLLGQLISNPTSVGTAIAIHGDKGVGKTSIVKEGISKILNRPFAFIPLGGATDSSYLEGHSFTYEGSTWGKIVQILIDSKVMNPVIYFDELDKISDTPKGEEIVSILTHLTDTTQNMEFHDKYFSDIHFDMSKCIFIFSYNDETKINPILRDRMYRIYAKGYDRKEKTIIARDYLLPKIRQEVNFHADEIICSDEAIGHVIEKFGGTEAGVRNLKRYLEIIHTKLNLCRLMKPGTKMFDNNTVIQLSYPFHVTPEIINKLITQKDQETNPFMHMMYV